MMYGNGNSALNPVVNPLQPYNPGVSQQEAIVMARRKQLAEQQQQGAALGQQQRASHLAQMNQPPGAGPGAMASTPPQGSGIGTAPGAMASTAPAPATAQTASQPGVLDPAYQKIFDQYEKQVRGPAQTRGQGIGTMVGSAVLPALVGKLGGLDSKDSMAYGIGAAAQQYEARKNKKEAGEYALLNKKQELYDQHQAAKAAGIKAGAEKLNVPAQIAFMEKNLELKPGMPGFDERYEQLFGRSSGQSININNIPKGNMGATKPTQNRLQEDLVNEMSLDVTLGKLGEMYYGEEGAAANTQFFEMPTQFGMGANKWRELSGLEIAKLKPDDKVKYKEYKKFHKQIEQVFNQYRRLVTGAAAAKTELDALRESYLNGDMSSSEFETTLELLRDNSQRSQRLRRKLLREGFMTDAIPQSPETDPKDYTQDTKTFGFAYDMNKDDTSEDYAEDLLRKGTAPEDIPALLAKDGYEPLQ